jgi:hypothetical protein
MGEHTDPPGGLGNTPLLSIFTLLSKHWKYQITCKVGKKNYMVCYEFEFVFSKILWQICNFQSFSDLQTADK